MLGERIKTTLYRKGLLVRIAVIAFFAVIAAVLVTQGNLQKSMVLGTCIGTIVSVSVTWMIGYLENPEITDVPVEFVAAAKIEVNRANYYREFQRIWIRVEQDREKSEIIVLELSSRLVPTKEVAQVHCPDVGPPSGTTLVDMIYKVDGHEVPVDQYREISRHTTDHLQVRYKITDATLNVIFDDHLWPCPVLSYSVTYSLNKVFSCVVSRKVGGIKTQALAQQKNESRKEIEFFGHGAAFTRQGLRWRIERIKTS